MEENYNLLDIIFIRKDYSKFDSFSIEKVQYKNLDYSYRIVGDYANFITYNDVKVKHPFIDISNQEIIIERIQSYEEAEKLLNILEMKYFQKENKIINMETLKTITKL